MKTKFTYIILALFSLSVFSAPAHAVLTNSANGNATATVVVPILIAAVQDLAFGKIAANTGGTVTVNNAGVRAAGGTVVLVNSNSTTTEATFDVTGDPNSSYTITLPANGTVNIDDGAAHTMAVDNFTSNPASPGTLSGAGTQTIHVGAKLTVGSGQTPGAYTGTFAVTVDYN